MYSILCAYLSEKDPKLLDLFNEYINKKTIIQVDLPFYLGITSASPIFHNVYVKIRRKYNIEDLFTITHEMSHARVLEDFIKLHENKTFNKFTGSNIYLEVYPRLHERNLIQFLLDNNILVEDVKKYIIKWLFFFKEILLKNMKSYNENKKIDYLDIKDINSFLYRDLLFLNNFNLNDISSAMKTSCEEIKRLVKL